METSNWYPCPAHLKITANFGKVHNRTQGNKNKREKLVVIRKGDVIKEFMSTSDCARWLKMGINQVSGLFNKGCRYEGWEIIQIGDRKALVKQRPEGSRRKMFSNEEVVKIKQLIVDGIELHDIANKFDATKNTILLIKNKKTYGHIPWQE